MWKSLEKGALRFTLFATQLKIFSYTGPQGNRGGLSGIGVVPRNLLLPLGLHWVLINAELVPQDS